MFARAAISKNNSWRGILDSSVMLYAALGCIFILSAYISLSTLVIAIENYSEVPYTDQWTLMPFVRDVLDGKFDVGALFSQQNEHRIAFMRTVFLIDAWLLGGMEYLPLLMNWVFMIGSALTLCMAASIMRTDRPGARASVFCLLFACVFSATQIEVITFPTGCMNLGVFFFAMTSLNLLSHLNKSLTVKDTIIFSTAVLIMIACEMCSANGLFIWPLALFLLFTIDTRNDFRILTAVIGCVACALYMHGYHTPPYHSDPMESLKHPVELVNYLLANFGAPFGFLGLPLSSCAGLVLVLLFTRNIYLLVRYYPNQGRTKSFLMCFCFFLMITSALTALGRLRFGVEQAQASRYCTPVLLLWAVSILVGLSSWPDEGHGTEPVSTSYRGRGFPVLSIIPVVAFVAALAVVQPAGNWIFVTTDKLRQAGMLLSLGVDNLYPDLSGGAADTVVKTGADFMRQRHLSVFKSSSDLHIGDQVASAFRILPSKSCVGAVDLISPTSFGADIQHVQGWSWSFNQQEAPKIVLFSADGIVSGWAVTGVSRPDVARAVPSVDSQLTGYYGFVRRREGQQIQSYVLEPSFKDVCPT